MLIGILSDTHGVLPAEVFPLLKDVEHILHAGDIGDLEIITELEALCPVTAVSGNIDGWDVMRRHPLEIDISLAGLSVHMKHDIGDIKNFRYSLFKKHTKPDLVIFGHTHRPFAEYFSSCYYINPGSVSRPLHKSHGTLVLLDLSQKPLNAQFIKL